MHKIRKVTIAILLCFLLSVITGCRCDACGGLIRCSEEVTYLCAIDKNGKTHGGIECEAIELCNVEFRFSSGSIVSSLPEDEFIDGHYPIRIVGDKIVCGWCKDSQGTEKFEDHPSNNLRLFPILVNFSVPDIPETPFEGVFEIPVAAFSGRSKCQVVDLEDSNYDADSNYYFIIDKSVEVLYIKGSVQNMKNVSIIVNTRETDFHLVLDEVNVQSVFNKPFINCKAVNSNIVSIEAIGNCYINGNGSEAINGENVSLIGVNGRLAVNGDVGNKDHVNGYCAIEAGNLSIGDTIAVIHGGDGVNGANGVNAENGGAHGGAGQGGGKGGNAIYVKNSITMYKSKITLVGGDGGNGGNGGNATTGAGIFGFYGGAGGNGGNGGNAIATDYGAEVKVCFDGNLDLQVSVFSNGGKGGIKGEDSSGAHLANYTSNGSDGVSGYGLEFSSTTTTSSYRKGQL